MKSLKKSVHRPLKFTGLKKINSLLIIKHHTVTLVASSNAHLKHN